MRHTLALSIVVLLLGGVGAVQGQERVLTVRGGAPDTTEWAVPVRPSAALDSARRWTLKGTRSTPVSPVLSDPSRLGTSQRAHPSLRVRQLGGGNVVLGRPPGLPPTPAGQARIVQVGRRNAVLPVRMLGAFRVAEDGRDRPLGGMVGARNRLVVVQGARPVPARAARVRGVAQIGRFHRADVRQMGVAQRVRRIVQRGWTGERLGLANAVAVRQRGRENLVRRVVQAGSFNRIRGQQRGALNTLSLQQVGVDSTARVQQDGVGNVARITQNSIGV